MAGSEAPSRAFQRRVLIQAGIVSAVVGTISGFVAVTLTRQSPYVMPSDVSAQSFHLTDPSGKVLSAWVGDENGVSSLGFYGGKKLRLLIGNGQDGKVPLIRILDENGQARFDLSFSVNGTAMEMRDSKGKLDLWILQADDERGGQVLISLGRESERGRVEIQQQLGKDGNIKIRGNDDKMIWDSTKIKPQPEP